MGSTLDDLVASGTADEDNELVINDTEEIDAGGGGKAELDSSMFTCRAECLGIQCTCA